MKIVIAGCGKIGLTVIGSLVAEGHNIVAIDSSPEVIAEITNLYDVMGLCGNVADSDILFEADVSDADLFVSFTGSDELNMLSCFLARKMGAKNTIARIRAPEYNDHSLSFMKQHLELSMSINPERLAAHEIFNLLKFPTALKIESFSRRYLEIVILKLKEDSFLDGIKLSDLRTKFNAKVLVCCIQRGDEVYIPDGNFVLKSGDKIGITATHTEFQKLFKGAGHVQKQAKNTLILGGGRVSYYLADMLTNIGTAVKVIDQDEKTCEILSEILPKATIIHGNGAQQELLMEEGLLNADAFVSLTGMDEQNILISKFAETQNVPKVIAKVNSDELTSMAEKLGLDSVVSPKKIVSDMLISYVRALQNSLGSNVETLYKIMDDKAEALEFNVRDDFAMAGVPLKDLKIRKNILIGGIIRDRKTIIPGGNDTILVGDKVVVIAANHRLNDLSDILV
ncbi:MAG: Trk system potassium transporter TrkA [Clostridia bacterium]|nr:Trk system potassium transporter TrkA [Clostridia bacterium]